MCRQGLRSERLGFLVRKPVVVENSAGRLSSDAGLLVVREFDQRIGMPRALAEVLDDDRHQPMHAMLAMVRQRVCGILAGCVERLTVNRSTRTRSTPHAAA